MFPRVTEYEAAYVGIFPASEKDAGPALRWARAKAKHHSCGITAVAPTQQHFRDHPMLAGLPAAFQRATPRTLRNVPRIRPVVVAFWPSAKDLEQLDGTPGLKALVVVPWQEEDIGTWRQARGAVDLLGRHPLPEAPGISDPVVAVALRDLTRVVNLSTGVAHPRDRSMAIHAFKILKSNGHRYDPAEIRAWAMANGWAAHDARVLSGYAAGVLAGKRYRVGSSGWNPQILHMWRKKARGN
jgi:hypothetical protein